MVFLALITLLSGSNDDHIYSLTALLEACGDENTLGELDWLKAEFAIRAQNPTEHMKYSYIVQGTLDGTTVFVYEDCITAIFKFSLIYNCQGTALIRDGSISLDSVENKKISGEPTILFAL